MKLLSKNGLLVVNKPKGVSSFRIVEMVRRLSGQRKIGHAGTLDPLASGVLVLCLGEATKLSDYIMSEEKVYKVEGKLGERTSSFDAESEVIEKVEVDPKVVTKENLQSLLDNFRGWIEQTPPMYSALKIDGAPLYKLARRGISVDRAKRKVLISELELLDFNIPFYTLQVTCSKGTYIRTLIDDIGVNIGVYSYVTMLERTRSGSFNIDESLLVDDKTTKEDFDKKLISMESAVSRVLPVEEVAYELAKKISNGYLLAEISPELASRHECFAVTSFVDGSQRLLALVENKKTVRIFSQEFWSK